MCRPEKDEWVYPQTTGEVPQPRSNHAVAAMDRRFYVFGGSFGDIYQTVGDFYYCDVGSVTFRAKVGLLFGVAEHFFGHPHLPADTLTWTRLTTKKAPSKRVGHKMIALRGKLYLFGGGIWSPDRGWIEQYNDTWIYDPGRWTPRLWLSSG